MSKLSEKMARIRKEARKQPEYWIEGIRLDFITELEKEMEHQGITRAELSRKLGKTRAYVSKFFNANLSNFTLKTMVEFAMAVNAQCTFRMEPMDKEIQESGMMETEMAWGKRKYASYRGPVSSPLSWIQEGKTQKKPGELSETISNEREICDEKNKIITLQSAA